MSREDSKRAHTCPRCGNEQGCLQGKTPKLEHQDAKKFGGCGFKGVSYTGKKWVKDPSSKTPAEGWREGTEEVRDARFAIRDYTKEEMENRIARKIGAPVAPTAPAPAPAPAAPAAAPTKPASAPQPQGRVPVKTGK